MFGARGWYAIGPPYYGQPWPNLVALLSRQESAQELVDRSWRPP